MLRNKKIIQPNLFLFSFLPNSACQKEKRKKNRMNIFCFDVITLGLFLFVLYSSMTRDMWLAYCLIDWNNSQQIFRIHWKTVFCFFILIMLALNYLWKYARWWFSISVNWRVINNITFTHFNRLYSKYQGMCSSYNLSNY
jgi:hypothetical protein